MSLDRLSEQHLERVVWALSYFALDGNHPRCGGARDVFLLIHVRAYRDQPERDRRGGSGSDHPTYLPPQACDTVACPQDPSPSPQESRCVAGLLLSR